MSEQPTKTKKPRRAALDVAATYAEKAKKARDRAIKGTDVYRVLEAAQIALSEIASVPMPSGLISEGDSARVTDALHAIEAAIQTLLKEGL